MKIKLASGDYLNISESNAKIGDMWSVSVSPIITCKKNVPCSNFCYACKNQNFRKNANKSWKENTATISNKKNVDDIIKKMSALINALNIKFFRWNVGGDFGIYRHFELACKIAENCPDCQFLAFTKFYKLAFCERPENFNLILSAWNELQPTAAEKKRCAVAYYCDGSREMPINAVKCSGNCEECKLCFFIKSDQAVYFNKH